MTSLWWLLARPATFADPPLDPSGDEGRRLLREELADPRYHDRNVVQRLLEWIARQIDRGIGAAGDVGLLPTAVAIVVTVLLAAGLIWLVGRVRRTPGERHARRPALPDARISATELRRRADSALADGDPAAAIIDGFRAMAVRQIERGVIDDVPQATADELVRSIAAAHTRAAERLAWAAREFDEVHYGDHATTYDAAAAVLALDDELAGPRTGSRAGVGSRR